MPNYYEIGQVLPYSNSNVFISATTASQLLHGLHNSLKSHSTIRNVCALLNLNTESKLCFGISDMRAVTGIQLNRQERDEARLMWDQITSEKIFPRLTHTYAAIYFIQVLNTSMKSLNDTFVVEIHLKPQIDVLYSIKEGPGRCYLRRSGADIELTPEDVRLLAIQRKMKIYSGTIQGLLNDIGILKSEMKNDKIQV